MLLPWTRININCRKLRCVSRTIHDLSVWNKLWSTHVNIVRLTEPIRRCVRWRTQVFKTEGFVCKRFVLSPSPPPLSFFGPRFVSRAVITENPFPRSFIAPKPNGNACYAGYYCVAFNETSFYPRRVETGKSVYIEGFLSACIVVGFDVHKNHIGSQCRSVFDFLPNWNDSSVRFR